MNIKICFYFSSRTQASIPLYTMVQVCASVCCSASFWLCSLSVLTIACVLACYLCRSLEIFNAKFAAVVRWS